MKLRHNIPIKAIEKARREMLPEPVGERYEQELESACRKAHRAWRSAKRRLRTAERKATKTPTAQALSLRDEVRAEVVARLKELHEIEALMRGPVGGANWSGKGSVRITPKGKTL